MIYPRYVYGDPSAPSVNVKTFFGCVEMTLPKPEYPITPLENFRRSVSRQSPAWTPMSLLDFQMIAPNDMIKPTKSSEGLCVGMDFTHPHTEDYTFTDWLHTDWTYVHSAGGPMLTPGFVLCDDVTEWREYVKFPVLSDWEWETYRDNFMKNEYDPDKVLAVDVGLGCSERLVSILGGYTEAMLAFATEPDSCREFFEAFIDHDIELFDKLMENYPINLITYHDDWSNEKDTFFSPAMLENMLMGPTKRFVDHVKSRGVIFEFHICGNMTRFLPYFEELGVDLLQIQRRVVDYKMVKEKYGSKFGFCGGIEGVVYGGPLPSGEQLVSMVRNTIDLYASKGGFYFFAVPPDPELAWIAASEIYAYSREFYEHENSAK